MLLSFAVTNFRSIRERVELSMEKSGLKGLNANFFKAPGKKQLLKSAVIYGANASGKSGFLRAIQAMEFLVLNSSDFKPDRKIGPYEPFRLDKTCMDKPVIFEITFITRKIQYDYKIAFTSLQIEEEELHYYPNNAKTLLYSRIANKEVKFGDSYRGAKKTLEKLMLKNQLLLTKAVENNVEMLFDPYHFFSRGLMVLPIMQGIEEDDLARLYAKRLAENKNSTFSKRFNALICALDTGITEVSVEEADWSKVDFGGNVPEDIRTKIQEKYKYDIKTQHPVYDGKEQVGFSQFEIDEESAGTKSLFAIGGVIIEALEGGMVLMVDEFEKNLHPGITQYLIKLFHNPLTNPRNAQLVFATHDITQLSSEVFRRDQVWFTEKNEYGTTSLVHCSDITGIRLNTPLDKWYVSGRFGATPIIDDTDFLIAMQHAETEV